MHVRPCGPTAGVSRHRTPGLSCCGGTTRTEGTGEQGMGPRLGCGLGMWVRQQLPAWGPQKQTGLDVVGRVCPPGQLPACPASVQGAQCIGLSQNSHCRAPPRWQGWQAPQGQPGHHLHGCQMCSQHCHHGAEVHALGMGQPQMGQGVQHVPRDHCAAGPAAATACARGGVGVHVCDGVQ